MKHNLWLILFSLAVVATWSRPPLESFERYSIILVHGVGGCTVPDGWSHNLEWAENSECGDDGASPVKSSIFGEEYDDDVPRSDPHNWMGSIGNGLMKKGLIGHTFWYDFYQPWRNPIYGSENSRSTALSQNLGRRYNSDGTAWNGNPMGDISRKMGKTSFSFWLPQIIQDLENGNDAYNIFKNTTHFNEHIGELNNLNAPIGNVLYSGHTGPYLELAKQDYKQWYRFSKLEEAPNEILPKKYILIGHSMGGLTSRDYLTGQFYEGDIDKLITLDSPHEGSGIANYVDMWSVNGNSVYGIAVGKVLFGAGLSAAFAVNPQTRVYAGIGAGFASSGAFSILQKVIQDATQDYVTLDHAGYGIQDMALSEIHAPKMSTALEEMANRTRLNDPWNNGYRVPFFDLVATTGVPTPGGFGVHHAAGGSFFASAWLTGLPGWFFENLDQGQNDFVEHEAIMMRIAIGFGTGAIWNDWGSGFVPTWSGKGANVKIFNDQTTVTERITLPVAETSSGEEAGLLLAGLLSAETAVSLYPGSNLPPAIAIRVAAYAATGATLYARSEDWARDFANYIGFHGRMAYHVDNKAATDAPLTDGLGWGSNKKIIDQLLWEKPAISFKYRPTDSVAYALAAGGAEYTQGGSISMGAKGYEVVFSAGHTTPEELTAHDKSGTIKKWKFENERPFAYLRGITANTRITGFFLTDNNGELISDNLISSTCELSDGFTQESGSNAILARSNNNGLLKCDLTSLVSEGTDVGLLIKGYSSTTVGKVAVDIGNEPGWSYQPNRLEVADGNDWSRDITFKTRRYQRWKRGGSTQFSLNTNAADMVDYYREDMIVVNQISRYFEFEVDDLQPDRMINIQVNFNYGDLSLVWQAKSDPNQYSVLGAKDAEYDLVFSYLGQTKTVVVKNPVDSWGRFIIDFDLLEQILGETFQPILEGRNHLSISLKNRWQMASSQALHYMVPGVGPAVIPVFPQPNVAVTAATKIEFDVELVYGQSDELTTNQIVVEYKTNGEVTRLSDSELSIVREYQNGEPTTKYHVSSTNNVNWGSNQNILDISIQPTIQEVNSKPSRIRFEVIKDIVPPQIEIDYGMTKSLIKPTSGINTKDFVFMSVNENNDGPETGLLDVWLDIYSTDKVNHYGNHAREAQMPNGARSAPIWSQAIVDGIYIASLRSHDHAFNSKESFIAWKAFTELPFYGSAPDSRHHSDFGKEGLGLSACATSGCMTNWSVPEEIGIVISRSVAISHVNFSNNANVVTRSTIMNGPQGWTLYTKATGLAVYSDVWNGCTIDNYSSINFGHIVPTKGSVKLKKIDGSWTQELPLVPKTGGACGSFETILIPKPTNDKQDTWEQMVIPTTGDYEVIVSIVDGAGNEAHTSVTKYLDFEPVSIEQPRVMSYRLAEGNEQRIYFKTKEPVYNVGVSAHCGDQHIQFSPATTSGIKISDKYEYEFIGSGFNDGRCIALIQVSDGAQETANQSKTQLVFLSGHNFPEIMSPAGALPIIQQGTMEVRGVAEMGSFDFSASFIGYELKLYSMQSVVALDGSPVLDEDGFPVVERGAAVEGLIYSSALPVYRDGGKPGLLGNLDMSNVVPGLYQLALRVEDSDGTYETSQNIQVVGASSTPPSIRFAGLPESHHFAEGDLGIHWLINGVPSGNAYRISMKVDQYTAETKIRTVKNTELDLVSLAGFSGVPTKTDKGAYIWVTQDAVNLPVYHLRLNAKESNCRFKVFINRMGNQGFEILPDPVSGETPSEISIVDLDDEMKVLTINSEVFANTNREFTFRMASGNDAYLSLATSQIIENGVTSQLWNSQQSTQSLLWIGSRETSHDEGSLVLPGSAVASSIFWNGISSFGGVVADGRYKITLSLALENSSNVAQVESWINLKGLPIQFRNVNILPVEGFAFAEMLNGSDQNISLQFSLTKAGFVSARIREKTANPILDMDFPAPTLCASGLLNRCMLFNQSSNYSFEWDGTYNKNLKITPSLNGYEIILSAYNAIDDLDPSDQVVLDLPVQSNDLRLVSDMSVWVEEASHDKTATVGNVQYPLLTGLTDFLVKAVPTGTYNSHEDLNLRLYYNGQQKVPVSYFDEYKLGVQLRRPQMEFWAVGVAAFKVQRETEIVCDNEERTEVHVTYEPLRILDSDVNHLHTIELEFEASARAGSVNGYMKRSNSELILIPKSRLTKQLLENELKIITDIHLNDEKGRFNAWRTFQTTYSAFHFVWGPTVDDDFTKAVNSEGVLERVFGDSDLPLSESRETQLASEFAETSRMSQYYDPLCDIGIVASSVDGAECESVQPEQSAVDITRGNSKIDDGELIRFVINGEVEYDDYDPDLHSDGITASAVSWLRDIDDPVGCLDRQYTKLRIRYNLTSTDDFWGQGPSAYGQNNLVNRYLTLDPENMFVWGLDYGFLSFFSQRYIGANQPLTFSFLKQGEGTLINSLKALSFSEFPYFDHEIPTGYEAERLYWNADDPAYLSPDLQLVLHPFNLKAKKNQTGIHVGLTINHSPSDINDDPYQYSAPVNFPSDANPVIPTQGSTRSGMLSGFSISLSLAAGSLKYWEETVPWPATQSDLVSLSDCSANETCGFDSEDKLYITNQLDMVGDQGFTELGREIVVPSAQMGLLPNGTCCGYDLTPYLKTVGTDYADVQNGETILKKNLAVIGIERPVWKTFDDDGVSTTAQFHENGNLIRKTGEEFGTPYLALNDPLLNYDKDGDGLAGEDGMNPVPNDEDGDATFDEDQKGALQALIRSHFPFVSSGNRPTLTKSMLELLRSSYSAPNPINTSDISLALIDVQGNLWDHPDVFSTWVGNGSKPAELFHKDGTKNNDLRLVASGMELPDLTLNQIHVAPQYHSQGQKRLAHVLAQIPATGEYSLYVSGSEGWSQLSLADLPRATDNTSSHLAWWNVKTSGPQRVVLVRDQAGDKTYTYADVGVFSQNQGSNNQTILTDELGQAQVSIAGEFGALDVSMVPANQVPWGINQNYVAGPVVKIAPAADLRAFGATLSLRINCEELSSESSEGFRVMVVDDQGWSTALEHSSWLYYDDGVETSYNHCDYAVVTGVVPKRLSAAETLREDAMASTESIALTIDQETHTITTDDINANEAVITMHSEPQTRRLGIGEMSYFDLNGDGKPDYRVQLKNIIHGEAVWEHGPIQNVQSSLPIQGYFVANSNDLLDAIPIQWNGDDGQTTVPAVMLSGSRDGRYEIEVLSGTTKDIELATSENISLTHYEQGYSISANLMPGSNYFFARYKDFPASSAVMIKMDLLTGADESIELDPFGSPDIRLQALWVRTKVDSRLHLRERVQELEKSHLTLKIEADTLNAISVERLSAGTGDREFSAEFVDFTGSVLGQQVINVPIDHNAPRATGVADQRVLMDDLGLQWVWVKVFDALTGIELARTYAALPEGLKTVRVSTPVYTESEIIWKAYSETNSVHTELKISIASLFGIGRVINWVIGATDSAGNSVQGAFEQLDYFENRKQVVVQIPDKAIPQTNVQDYVVLLRLHAGNFDFSTSAMDGSDIRVLSNHGDVLGIDVERWNPYLQFAEIWVRIPVIRAGTKEVTLELAWGKKDTNAWIKSPPTPWGTEYRGVYHFNESYLGVAMPQPAYAGAVIHTDEELVIGDRVQIEGLVECGSMVLGYDAVISGNVMAQGLVELRNRSVIQGDLKTGGSLLVESVADAGSISGNTITNEAPPWNPLNQLDSYETGSVNVLVPIDGAQMISAGLFSSIVAGDRSVITLNPGVYHLDVLSIGNDVELHLSDLPGPVVLNIRSQFTVGHRFKVNLGAQHKSSDLLWNLSQSQGVVVLEEAVFHGIIHAPNASVSIRRGAFTGALWSQSAALDHGVQVKFIGLPIYSKGNSVPSGKLFDASLWKQFGDLHTGASADGLVVDGIASTESILSLSLPLPEANSLGFGLSFWIQLENDQSMGQMTCGTMNIRFEQGALVGLQQNYSLSAGWHFVAIDQVEQSSYQLYLDGEYVEQVSIAPEQLRSEQCVWQSSQGGTKVDEIRLMAQSLDKQKLALDWQMMPHQLDNQKWVAPNTPVPTAPRITDRQTAELDLVDTTGYVDSWQVERLDQNGNWVLVRELSGSETMFVETDLLCGEQREYRVRSGANHVWSDWSENVTMVADRCALASDYLIVQVRLLSDLGVPVTSPKLPLLIEVSADPTFETILATETSLSPVRHGLVSLVIGKRFSLPSLLSKYSELYIRVKNQNQVVETVRLSSMGTSTHLTGRISGEGAPGSELSHYPLGTIYLDTAGLALYIKTSVGADGWHLIHSSREE